MRSVSSMVMAPASTGRDSSSRNTVTSTDQTNSGMRCMVMPGARMLKMVVMKLMAPRIELAPARCSDRITRSKAGPVLPMVEKGGYIVQPPPKPLPGPLSTNSEVQSTQNEATSSQKLMLFMRGKAMSGAPIMMGTKKLPKPPIMAGMTMKKIMIRAWAVTTTL